MKAIDIHVIAQQAKACERGARDFQALWRDRAGIGDTPAEPGHHLFVEQNQRRPPVAANG